MKRSTERILVSHVGSLARPEDLMEMLVARNEGRFYDANALARRTRESVVEVVQKQIDCGIGSRVGHPQVGWAKFQAMAEGARIATRELWGRN